MPRRGGRRREVEAGEDQGRADPHQREGDRRPRLLAARQVIGERHHDKAGEADEIEPEEDLAGENRHHGGSFEKMIVPEAANMPPTPWQTDTLAPAICAGAMPRICRTLSCNAYMPYMPECM